jgi:hypothetical protein
MDQYNLVSASDLPANASLHEWKRGMPDPVEMQLMWAGWLVVSVVAAVSSSAIIIGILASPTARASSFNLYLVMLAVPDFVFSSSCALTCALNFFNRFYTSVQMCDWQAWYVTFGIAGSFWLNAAVAAEVHTLLKQTKALRDYHPPSHRTVLVRCLAIYALCAVVSSWHLWRFFPFAASPMHGVACMASGYDQKSTLFFWLAYIPMLAGLPSAYAIYVAVDCWRTDLLNFKNITPVSRGSRVLAASPTPSCPGDTFEMDLMRRQMHARKTRQARQLSIYFCRIFLSVLVMWAPSLFLLILLPTRSGWGVWAGGTWGHLQAIVSAIMCLTKPDIREAVLGHFQCTCGRGEERNIWPANMSILFGTNKQLGGTNTWAKANVRAGDARAAASSGQSCDTEHTLEDSNFHSGGRDDRMDASTPAQEM